MEVFEDVILAACQKLEITPVRADQIAVAGEITEQVFRHIYEDDVVIADVSGGNPNVMYELGLRHTTGKLTIQIGEFGQLPFDVSAIRTIQFSRSPRGMIDARKELEKALQAGIIEGQDPLTATRVLHEVQSAPAGVVTPSPAASKELESDDDAPGFLDSVSEIESQMNAMTEDANSIAETIETIGIVTESAGSAMEKAAQSGSNNSSRLTLVAKYATEIKDPVDKLERHANGFAQRMEEIGDNVVNILKYIEQSSPEERPEDYEDFLDSLISMAESSREGMEGLNSFGTAAQGLGSLSRQLRGPGKKIANAVNSMRTAMASVDTWERAARSLSAHS
ncbi:hypothetical protein OG724_18405 [[Kitasatospora] papulosa]|uniref:hypothetical protein n=1 Tax=[Kitasatospora] papulosa TaxID=1464011 RepID=UPI002E319FAA|nr:hypothetical protein [[Kitasatospora] papulosa]